VEHAAATFDVTIPPCPLALTVSVDPTLNVMGDPTEVLRVLRNLLQNASRHGRTPGQKATRVTIRARRQRAWVDLEVRDHGPGVPAAQLDRLTVPFFRGDTARTDAPGSGLGLAIVEQAVRRMDGSVQLRNAPDGGLLVQIRLLAGPDAPRSGHDATDRGRTDRARTDLAEKALSGEDPGRRAGRHQED
jgi:two-component system osmolarity sensor histidine kinase EnvZ